MTTRHVVFMGLSVASVFVISKLARMSHAKRMAKYQTNNTNLEDLQKEFISLYKDIEQLSSITDPQVLQDKQKLLRDRLRALSQMLPD